MDSFRHRRSPGADSFLGIFSQSEPSGGVSAAGDELDEEEIFWTDTESRDANLRSTNHPFSMASHNPNPSPKPTLSRPGLRRIPDRKFGILSALPEEDNKGHLVHRNPFSPSSSSAAASPLSSSSSSSSSARMIPVMPKPKADYALSVPGGNIFHQSAPVNVQMMPRRARKPWAELERDMLECEDVDDEEMLPPHEIVARAAAKESPLTTFSMLEGVGRTLKGRDLRRVRNAVWRQTDQRCSFKYTLFPGKIIYNQECRWCGKKGLQNLPMHYFFTIVA